MNGICRTVAGCMLCLLATARSAVELRIEGAAPGEALGAVFRIGSVNPMTLTVEWDDNATRAVQVVPESESLTLSLDGQTQTLVLPSARLNFKELKVPYYFRPRPRRYTEAQQIERLADWQAHPGSHAVDVRFEAIPDTGGCQFFIDRRYAGRMDHPAPLRALTLRLPDGGTVQAAAALRPDADPRYLTLDFGAAAQPGALTNAQSSLAAGMQMLAGVPMLVSDPERAGAIARVRQMKGSWALECDEYLSRTTFDGMPESQMLTLPQMFYHRAWVLFAVDPDPALDARMTLRLTRFAGSSIVGRGSAFAEMDIGLPRPGEPLPDGMTDVGEVRLPSAGGELVLPLLLARVTVPLGDMLDLLASDAQDPAAEVKIGPYLDFEILGRRGVLSVQWDNRHKPGGEVSAAHVFGVTLERAPAELRLIQDQPGNIFHNDETPQLTAAVRAARDGDYTLSWCIRDVEGALCREAAVTNGMTAGETADCVLPLAMDAPGYYDIRIELAEVGGETVLTHDAAFALLGPDTREAEYESPYGVWWFGGPHLTVSDIAVAGPLHWKAGLRRTVSTRYSEAEMAPWKMTQASHRWRFKLSDLNDFEAARARVGAELAAQRLRYPHCDNVLIFHESHANTMPVELAGMQPNYDDATRDDCLRKADLANRAGAFYRETHPDLKIIVGNSGGSIRLMADLLRYGFDRTLCDFIGIETPGQAFMPESISEHNVMGAWASREIGRLYGHEIPPTATYEFSYRLDRLLGPRGQAEFYVRDMLLGHALGFAHISPAVLDDAGGSYGNTLWGASGLLKRNPLLYPKPAYVAVATATRMLDRAAHPRVVTNGSLTVYTLEMQRQRATTDYVYAGWTARGEAELTCLFDAETEVEIVDLYGRGGRLQTVDGRVAWRVGTAAGYLVSPVAIRTVAIAERTYSQDQPPPGYVPANRMDRLDEWALSSDRYLTWVNEAGGSFHDPNNWSPSRVPGTNDITLFALTNAPYAVAWSGPVTNFEFEVGAGDVTWNLQGHLYTLNVDCFNLIGKQDSPACLTVTNGTIKRTARTGRYDKPLTLAGSGTTLALRNAAFLDINYPIIPAGSLVCVDGPAAQFDAYGYSRLLSGLVVVTNAAFLSATSGSAVTAGGDLRVVGPGYRANLAFGGTVGIHADGAVCFDAGAEVRNATSQKMYFNGPMTLRDARYYYYYAHPDYGWIHLRAPRGILQGSGRIEMGRIILEGGFLRPGGAGGVGHLVFTGLITNALPASGAIEIELAGPDEEAYDRIRIEAGNRGPGVLHAGGILNVTSLNGYRPVVTTTFRIFDAAGIAGTFDQVNLPRWPGTWRTDALHTVGEITYTPPPTRSLLMIR